MLYFFFGFLFVKGDSESYGLRFIEEFVLMFFSGGYGYMFGF